MRTRRSAFVHHAHSSFLFLCIPYPPHSTDRDLEPEELCPRETSHTVHMASDCKCDHFSTSKNLNEHNSLGPTLSARSSFSEDPIKSIQWVRKTTISIQYFPYTRNSSMPYVSQLSEMGGLLFKAECEHNISTLVKLFDGRN